ncbi:hypothetical protein DYB35_006378 [Aphanomyces astaci]|uniref:RING-type domain-containing protein n=1 Tax=Aphanomyces astaci TaxID=112090 RepID=A0A3R6WIC4_APHAT|nr:hypothetical protein DYB35_006378 [Aphanomyces astaci]
MSDDGNCSDGGVAFDHDDAWNVDDAERGDAITPHEIHVREVIARELEDDVFKAEEGDGTYDILDGSISNGASEEYTIVQGKCPICLKQLTDGVLIKGCLHEFCFECILIWSKHVARRGALPLKCPVCRTPYEAVLANLRSAYDYDTVNVLHAASSTSLPHGVNSARRKRCLVYRRRHTHELLSSLWSPIRKTNDQAKMWIDRELHVLMGDDADTSLLLHIVFTYVDIARQHQDNRPMPPLKRARTTSSDTALHPFVTLRDALRDFLHDDADLFVHEVAKFMASRLNMTAYDKNDNYSNGCPAVSDGGRRQ